MTRCPTRSNATPTPTRMPEVRTVLDTSVLIAGGLDDLPGELAISAISIAELTFGVLVASTPESKSRRLRLLTSLTARFDPLPVDGDVAASYGQLAALTKEAGRQPRARTMDLLIAATAHAHGAQLATFNVDDFWPLWPELVLVTPTAGGWTLPLPPPGTPEAATFTRRTST